jgi:hypothetical protein
MSVDADQFTPSREVLRLSYAMTLPPALTASPRLQWPVKRRQVWLIGHGVSFFTGFAALQSTQSTSNTSVVCVIAISALEQVCCITVRSRDNDIESSRLPVEQIEKFSKCGTPAFNMHLAT